MGRRITCIVKGCRTNSDEHGYMFHKIPDDPKRQNNLIEHLKLQNKLRDSFTKVVNSSRICSLHYKPTDYSNIDRKILKKDALPSVFPQVVDEEEPLIKKRRIDGRFFF